MTLWQLIVRQIRQRALSSTLTALSVALGVMLVTSILLLQQQMEEHFLEPGRGYQVVVGAPGSALQLTLNAVYHMDKSPGLMPMRWWPELEENDSVALAAPYAVGDSFRGHRVVATTDALFDRRFPHPEGEGQDKLSAGRPFRFDRAALYRRLRGLGAGGFEAEQPVIPELPTVHLALDVEGLKIEEQSNSVDALEAAARSLEAQRATLTTSGEVSGQAISALVGPLRAGGVHSIEIDTQEDGDGGQLALHVGPAGARLYGEALDDTALRALLSAEQTENLRVSLLASDVPEEVLANILDVIRGAGVTSVIIHEPGHASPAPAPEVVMQSGHGNFEAVIGSLVAERLGIQVGDEIEPTHGVEGGHAHDHVHLWEVVGIFKRTGTPIDKVVFINLDSFFAIEEHMEGALIPGTNEAGLSAILLFPRPGVHKAVLLSSLNRVPEITVADVGEQIRNLFSIVGSVDTILMLVSIMVVILGVLSILVAIYNTMNERRREVAILRAIGASRKTVFGTIIGEAATLTLCGAIAGLMLGHLLVLASSGRIEEAAGFVPEAFTFLPIELGVAAIVVAGGALAGLVPAWKAYRTDIAANLKPLS